QLQICLLREAQVCSSVQDLSLSPARGAGQAARGAARADFLEKSFLGGHFDLDSVLS
ncbi:hypothetical protein A2U01_0111284, partial [Trifolium medium]|nr:hypothetical protein [Trifolium medium]